MLRRFEGSLRPTGGKRSPPLSRITSYMSDPLCSRECQRELCPPQLTSEAS